MAEIRWSVTAVSDLEGIENHIARDSPLHAVHFVDRLVEAVDRLEEFPLSGRVVPEFSRDDVREVIFRAYRVVYLLEDERVTILRVVHGARDLIQQLPREPWQVE